LKGTASSPEFVLPAALGLRAGSQLELAQLLLRERRPREGVVLLAGEQVPEERAQLARRGGRGRPA
jgi:hypothetical protein